MYPPSRALFAPFRVEPSPAAIRASLAAARGPLGLYLHVPFCETKCAYCDYEVVLLHRHRDSIDAYVDAAVAELASLAAALPAGIPLAGFDVGGGTPGVLSAGQFGRIVRAADRLFGGAPEISTETTPSMAAADPAKWKAIAAAGVSRVSMGVQTADPARLARLGRGRHVEERMRRGMDALRAAGFGLVNVDLMFGLPGLTMEAWEATLALAIDLAPDVITIYDTVYKNRPIARSLAVDRTVASVAGMSRDEAHPLPPPDGRDRIAWGAQYDRAFAILTAAGFRARYGSVNFSRVPGRIGTSRYLEARLLDGADYAGAGLYASSLAGDSWRFGRKSYVEWLALRGALAAEDLYLLPREHVMAKYLLLALSFGHLDAARFERRFGERLDTRFGEELAFLEKRGLFRCVEEEGAPRENPLPLPGIAGWEMVEGSFSSLPGIRALFYPEDALASLALRVAA
jgi:coproporphyrinogen III oxidase-like Fe-S oxidoreductase